MRQKQELAVIDLAIQQNNLSVAGKFLQKTKHVISFCNKNDQIVLSRQNILNGLIIFFVQLKQDTEMGLHWNLSLGKCKWLTAQSRADPKRRLQDTCTAFTNMRTLFPLFC